MQLGFLSRKSNEALDELMGSPRHEEHSVEVFGGGGGSNWQSNMASGPVSNVRGPLPLHEKEDIDSLLGSLEMDGPDKKNKARKLVRVEERPFDLKLESNNPSELAVNRDVTKTDISKNKIHEKEQEQKKEEDKNSNEDSFDNLSFLNY